MKARACELCNEEASLYCASDSAFLCCNCDARVHEANFLVARHIREILCCKCKCFAGSQISGSATPLVNRGCRSCTPENPSDDNDSLFSSSVCVSSTESCSTAPKKVQLEDRRKMEMITSCSSVTDASGENFNNPTEVTSAKMIGRKSRRRNLGSCARTSVDSAVEEIFVNWSRKLGVDGKSAVASLVSHALGFCLRKLTILPFRVAVATSFWFGLRFCGDRSLPTFQNLRRLEAISGVPAKLVVAAEAKLARILRERKGRRELVEGWAEC